MNLGSLLCRRRPLSLADRPAAHRCPRRFVLSGFAARYGQAQPQM